MIRTGKFKYIHNDGAAHELYDLQGDPGELVNLAQDPRYTQMIYEMKARLLEVYDPDQNPYRTSE